MNLSTIPVTPHALGFIKVACDDDPLFGEARTRNEFVITQRHHAKTETQAKLAPHPLQDKLASGDDGGTKTVTEIPIRLFFNKTENAIGIRYQAYSTPGNIPVCVGDGKNAKRLERAADNTQTKADVPCPGPELCDLVQSGRAACRRQVRMSVQVEGQNDPFSVFEVRSSSLNTYRALKSQLQLIERRFGGLRHVPLKLALWQSSNEASGFEPFSLMRLELDAESEVEAMKAVKAKRQELADAGINDAVDEPGDEGEAESFLTAMLEYPAVQDFYADAARRPGAESVTPRTAVRHAPAGGLGSVATAAIANAVRASGAGPAEAAP
jgi:hypothetical protein